MDGYAKCLFGSGKDAGVVEIKIGRGKNASTVMRVSDVTWPIPVTDAALDYACRGAKFSAIDTDGRKYAFTGIPAAARMAIKHASESIRGGYRNMAVKLQTDGHSVAEIQRIMATQEPALRRDYENFTQFGAASFAGGKPKPVMSKKQLEETNDIQVLKDLVRAAGLVG